MEQAVVRETLEETAFDFTPTALVGMYLLHAQSSKQNTSNAYLRFAFAGTLGQLHDQPLDTGIVRSLWMSYDEMLACRDQHRSPLVLQCVDDFLQGQRAPLSLLFTQTAMPGISDE